MRGLFGEPKKVPPAEMTFEQLRDKGFAYDRFDYKKYEKGLLRPDKKPGFNTPTGKVELYSTAFEKLGLDAEVIKQELDDLFYKGLAFPRNFADRREWRFGKSAMQLHDATLSGRRRFRLPHPSSGSGLAA
jgi:hypothetical protein